MGWMQAFRLVCLLSAVRAQSEYPRDRPSARQLFNPLGRPILGDDVIGDEIPGVAGVDYPVLASVPLTDFRCDELPYPGYYADQRAYCQVFYICERGGRGTGFLCPNGTLFNQEFLVCDWWNHVDCARAVDFYSVNEAVVRAMEAVDAAKLGRSPLDGSRVFYNSRGEPLSTAGIPGGRTSNYNLPLGLDGASVSPAFRSRLGNKYPTNGRLQTQNNLGPVLNAALSNTTPRPVLGFPDAFNNYRPLNNQRPLNNKYAYRPQNALSPFNSTYPYRPQNTLGALNNGYPYRPQNTLGALNNKYPQNTLGAFNNRYPYRPQNTLGALNNGYPYRPQNTLGALNNKYPQNTLGAFNNRYPYRPQNTLGTFNNRYPYRPQNTLGAFNNGYEYRPQGVSGALDNGLTYGPPGVGIAFKDGFSGLDGRNNNEGNKDSARNGDDNGQVNSGNENGVGANDGSGNGKYSNDNAKGDNDAGRNTSEKQTQGNNGGSYPNGNGNGNAAEFNKGEDNGVDQGNERYRNEYDSEDEGYFYDRPKNELNGVVDPSKSYLPPLK